MKTLNTKPSLLHFLYSSLYSLRAGFTKQVHPSNSLILAVYCETELPLVFVVLVANHMFQS